MSWIPKKMARVHHEVFGWGHVTVPPLNRKANAVMMCIFDDGKHRSVERSEVTLKGRTSKTPIARFVTKG